MMELYQEILLQKLSEEPMAILFPQLNISFKDVISIESHVALIKIKEILANENLKDPECYMKIEEIVKVFEGMGSGGGGRHEYI